MKSSCDPPRVRFLFRSLVRVCVCVRETLSRRFSRLLLTCSSSLDADLRSPGQVEQPALAVDLLPGAGDLLLVQGDSFPKHPKDLLGRCGQSLVDQQPEHFDF